MDSGRNLFLESLSTLRHHCASHVRAKLWKFHNQRVVLPLSDELRKFMNRQGLKGDGPGIVTGIFVTVWKVGPNLKNRWGGSAMFANHPVQDWKIELRDVRIAIGDQSMRIIPFRSERAAKRHVCMFYLNGDGLLAQKGL